LQNHEAFEFFDPIVGGGEAIYHTAGALGEGERVWILAKLPGEIRVIGDDITHNFLLLSNSHDGNSDVQIKFTPIRVVCENTLTQALREGPSLRIAHTRDVRERLRLAASMLNAIKVRFSELEGVFSRMAEDRMDQSRMTRYFRDVFPAHAGREMMCATNAHLPKRSATALNPNVSPNRGKESIYHACAVPFGLPTTGWPSTSIMADLRNRLRADS
jgi:phage/plasmid-like protein (TIGR03299 family)